MVSDKQDLDQSENKKQKITKTKSDERQERLAAKLRENLRRRKDQSRERKS